MRAFSLKCLVISSLVMASGPVAAQQTPLFSNDTAAPSPPLIEAAELEALALPPVGVDGLPDLAGDMGMDATDAALNVPELTVDAPPAATAPPAYESLPAYESPPAYASDSAELVSEPMQNESMLVPGYGQPYDIPIGDVIPEADSEIYSTNNWFRGGRWYSKQEFMMLLRTDLPLVHIAVDASTGVSDPFLVSAISTKDATFTYEAGTRLSLGKILGRDPANRDHSLEFSYMGMFDFTGRARLEEVNFDPLSTLGVRSLLGTRESNNSISINNVGIIGLGFPAPLIQDVPGFSRSRAQEILQQSDFNSFEMNYVIGARPARDRLIMQPDGRWVRHATPSSIKGFYTGFRYIRQNELFRYTGEGGRNRFVGGTGAVSFQEPIAESGEYRVTTDNDLFGIQIGSDVVRKRTDWVFGLNGRVGGLINFADRHSRLTSTVDNDDSIGVNLVTTSESESLNDETLTFLVEAGAYVAYYIRPNTSVRFGYNGLYMNGLATAAQNIGLMGSFPKFELTGDSLYHGMSLGFEMTW